MYASKWLSGCEKGGVAHDLAFFYGVGMRAKFKNDPTHR